MYKDHKNKQIIKRTISLEDCFFLTTIEFSLTQVENTCSESVFFLLLLLSFKKGNNLELEAQADGKLVQSRDEDMRFQFPVCTMSAEFGHFAPQAEQRR